MLAYEKAMKGCTYMYKMYKMYIYQYIEKHILYCRRNRVRWNMCVTLHQVAYFEFYILPHTLIIILSFRKQQFQRRNQIAASGASQVAHKQPKTTSRQIMLFFQFTINKLASVIVDRPIRKKNAHSSDR